MNLKIRFDFEFGITQRTLKILWKPMVVMLKSKLGKFTIELKPLRYFFLRLKSYYFGYYGPHGKFQNHTFSRSGLFLVESEIHPQV